MGYQTWIDDTTGKAYSDLQKTISSSIQGVASSFIQRMEKLKQDAKEAEEEDYKVQENTLSLRTKIGDAFKEGSNGINMQEAFNPVIDRIAQLNLKRLRHKLTDKEITQLAVLNNTISGAKDEIATLGAAGTSYVEAKSKAPGTAGAWSRTNDDKDPSVQFLRAGTNIDSTVEDVVRTLKIDLETGQRTWGAKAKAKNLITGEIEEIGGEINGSRLTQLMQPGNSGLFTTVPDYIKGREALIAGSSGDEGIFYSKAEADKLGNPDLTGKIKDTYLDKKNATVVENKGDNGSTIRYNTYNANTEFIKSNDLLNTNINATINSMSLADKKAFVRDITGQTDCTDAELNSQIKDYYIQSLTKDKTPEYNMIGGAAGIVTSTIAAPIDKYGKAIVTKAAKSKTTSTTTGEPTTTAKAKFTPEEIKTKLNDFDKIVQGKIDKATITIKGPKGGKGEKRTFMYNRSKGTVEEWEGEYLVNERVSKKDFLNIMKNQ